MRTTRETEIFRDRHCQEYIRDVVRSAEWECNVHLTDAEANTLRRFFYIEGLQICVPTGANGGDRGRGYLLNIFAHGTVGIQEGVTGLRQCQNELCFGLAERFLRSKESDVLRADEGYYSDSWLHDVAEE